MKKIVVILLLAAFAAGAWVWLRPHPDGAAEDGKPVAQVQVAPLRIQKIVESVPAFGVVEPTPSGARTMALAYEAIVKNIAVSDRRPRCRLPRFGSRRLSSRCPHLG